MSWQRTLLLTLDVDAPYGRVLLGSLTDTSLLNQPPDFIVGDKFLLQIQLAQRVAVTTDPAAAADPPAGTHFVFSGKAAGGSGSLLFYADAWTQCRDAENDPIPGKFEAVLDLNTDEFAAHIAASPAGAKILLGELEIRNSDNSQRRSLQFDLTGRPQVFIGDETQPVVGSDPYLRGYNAPDFRPAITDLTGGAASALDSIPTAALTAGYVVMFVASGALVGYLLTAGDTAEAAPGIIRPDDFAEGTNEKIWLQVL